MSASIIDATRPESSSLSVNISSVTLTVSFSLMIGTTSWASITSMQARWFRYSRRVEKLSFIVSTWPMVVPQSWNSLLYRPISCTWPTAEYSCRCSTGSSFRAAPPRPSRLRPHATAPLDTSSTWAPSARMAWTWSTRDEIRVTSSVPSGRVRTFDPILMTILFI